MKISKADKQRINEIITEYKRTLYLHAWTIDIFYVSEDEKSDGNDFIAATINSQDEYFRATLRIMPEFFRQSKQEQKTIILHELCHIVVSPYSAMYEKMINGKFIPPHTEHQINESITQKIAIIVQSCSGE